MCELNEKEIDYLLSVSLKNIESSIFSDLS